MAKKLNIKTPHEPVSHYIAPEDTVMINGTVRIPRQCKCGAVVEMATKTEDGRLYRGYYGNGSFWCSEQC